MAEFIVRETGYPGAVKQEVVGELVRCKDCKWFYGEWFNGGNWCVRYLKAFAPNDFCSYAGNREEGEQPTVQTDPEPGNELPSRTRWCHHCEFGYVDVNDYPCIDCDAMNVPIHFKPKKGAE